MLLRSPLIPADHHRTAAMTLTREEIEGLVAESFAADVSAVVFDELMRALMSILSSLNLTLVPLTSESTRAAAGNGEGGDEQQEQQALDEPVPENLVMKYPRDHEILHNLVNFCDDLLGSHHQNLFCRRWVFMFGEKLIHASSEFPRVADFYRLIATVFRICEHERYFEGLEVDTSALLENVAETMRAHAIASTELVAASGVSSASNSTRHVTFLLFSKFAREIISRSQQFKDELLSAAVAVVLALPREFLNVSLMLPSLEMAFRMGLSYEPLAE